MDSGIDLKVFQVKDGGEILWAITTDAEKARKISREYLRDSEHPEDYLDEDEDILELPMDKVLTFHWEEDHISDGSTKRTFTCAEWIQDQGEGFLGTTCF